MEKQKQPVRLKNLYSNEIVYCNNVNETVSDNNYVFIRVFSKENPQRIYLVNKAAYEVDN
jgi:hypothetical protein